MSEMGDSSPEKKSGCGLLNVFFGRRSGNGMTRRTTSTGSIPTASVNNHVTRIPSTPNSKRRRGASDDAFFDESASESDQNSLKQHQQPDRIIARPGPNYAKSPPMNFRQQNHVPPAAAAAHNNGPASSRSAPTGQVYGKKLPQGTIGLSGELDSMIADHQRSKGSSTLVRASSSNVMLFGNLGNLRQGGGNSNSNSNSNNVLDYLPRTAKEEPPNGKYSTSVMGNVVKKQNEESEKPASLCRAISTRMDPEELKILGNEDYKNGRFAEALALYDAAISIDPNKASYRSNKSAALTALGRLLEAVFECREAIRIEPQYQRAHNRLATLYLRYKNSNFLILLNLFSMFCKD